MVNTTMIQYMNFMDFVTHCVSKNLYTVYFCNNFAKF